MAVEDFSGALDFAGPTDEQLAAQDAAIGLPTGTTRNQLMTESGLNPKAVSPAGAQGLAQVMPATVDHWSQVVGHKLDPFNVDDALLMHRLTMQQNIQQFGNLPDALRAYNSGWNPAKWDNPETNGYVSKILGLIIPSANAAEMPQPFNGKLDAAVEPFDGQLDGQGSSTQTPTIEAFRGKLNTSSELPTWTDALKQTAKSLYQVPLAVAAGLVGTGAGIIGGAGASLAEQAGFAPPGAGLRTQQAIEQAMPFQNPDSPVSQTILEGMQQIAPSNLTHLATKGFSDLTGIPEAPETYGSHTMDALFNVLGFRKPQEALQSIAKSGEPTIPTPLEKPPVEAPRAPAAMLEAPKVVPQQDLPVAGENDPVLSAKPTTPPDISTPQGADATVANIISTPDVSAATAKLDTALRQVESGFVESNYQRVPLKMTNDQAAALGYDPAQMLSKQFGAPLSAPEVVQAANFAKAADTNLVGLMQKVIAGEDVPQETLMKAIAAKNSITDYLQQGLGENARAMRASQQVPATNSAMDIGLKNMMDSFDDRQMRMQAAQAIVNAAQDQTTLAQTAKALAEPTARSKINQIIVNSYLTSPLTHEVSLISHGSMPFSYLADQAVGAVLGLGDRSVAAMFGKEAPNVVTFGELGANLKGFFTGAVEGAQVWKKVWQTEAMEALPSEAGGRSFNSFGTGPVARIGNFPATEIMSHNQFFQAQVYRMALNGIAEREAWLSGLDPASKQMLAENIRKSPNEAQQAQAESIAKDYSFARPMGTLGKKISQMSNSNPVVKANLPFIKIGVNIGKQIVEHSPLAVGSGRFWKDVTTGTPAERNAAFAKMLVGTVVLNQAWQAAQNGKLTGSAPLDPAQKQAWLTLHPEKSYLGDDGKWHTHNQYGFVSDLLTFAANLAEIHDQWQKTHMLEGTIGTPPDDIIDKQISQAAVGMSEAMYEALLNKTFFRTLTNIVDTATANTEGKLRAGAGNYIAGLLPASPLAAFTTRESDPILRRTQDSVLDPLRARLPWVSPTMLPRINSVTGQVMDKLNPLVAIPQKSDKVLEEMVRLGTKIPQVPKNLTLHDGGDTLRPPMTPEEQNYVAQFRGQNAKATLDQMVQMPNWDMLPDATKSRLIGTVYSNFQTAAEQILTSKIAQENKERIIVEVRRAMINTTKGQPLLPDVLKLNKD